jgi:uncharacterized protein
MLGHRSRDDGGVTTTKPPESVASAPLSPRWGIPTAIVALVGFVVLSFGVSVALIALGVDPITAGIVATPVGWLALAGWPLLMTVRRGNGPRSDLAWRFRPVDLGIGALGGVVVLVAAMVFVLVYVQLTGDSPTSSLGVAAGEAHADWQVLALAALALGAPFVEELHFRGVWWSALRRRGLGGWSTLLLTAALFAVTHLEPTRVALLFAAGLAAGYVRMVTDRLGPAIVAHLLINGIAVIGLLSLL